MKYYLKSLFIFTLPLILFFLLSFCWQLGNRWSNQPTVDLWKTAQEIDKSIAHIDRKLATEKLGLDYDSINLESNRRRDIYEYIFWSSLFMYIAAHLFGALWLSRRLYS